MDEVKENFDRILDHGGVFIIFADYRDRQSVILGHQSHYGFVKKQDIWRHNWGFLSILDELWVNHDHGEEIAKDLFLSEWSY
jgi:hypothetical protein